MAVSFKCPNCSANLIFDADQQMMTCEYCGAKISPEEVAATEVFLNDEAMKQEAEADAQIHKDTTSEETDGGDSSGEKKEPDYLSDTDSVQFVCNSCGAAVITDQNTSATFCAFCGSPAIIAERLVDARKPDLVIPFKYGRENAIDSFFKWCKAGRFTPIDFIKDSNVEKMTGLYVPFWLFDNVVDMDYQATATTVSSSTSGRKTTTTTSYYKVIRKKTLHWNKTPLDGATHIDDKLMEIVEPFDYKKLTDFDMKYLAGFFADKYDVPAEKLEDRLQKRIEPCVDKMFKESTQKYSSVRDIKNNSKYLKPSTRYALLPVWILNYKYMGKTYTFAMNGQTGKIAGEPPISRVKLLILGLAILPLAALLFKLVVGGLILGGFF